MISYLAIALGSALGGMARFGVHEVVTRHLGWAAPWSTFVVNVIGSFLIGFLVALSPPEGRIHVSDVTRNFLLIGLLGGFTTFSTFSMQSLTLVREGAWLLAAANVVGSVVTGLLAAWLGHLAATALVGTR